MKRLKKTVIEITFENMQVLNNDATTIEFDAK